jgi:hypothetical protein
VQRYAVLGDNVNIGNEHDLIDLWRVPADFAEVIFKLLFALRRDQRFVACGIVSDMMGFASQAQAPLTNEP